MTGTLQSPARGPAQLDPARASVTSPRELGRIHECFHEQRPIAPALLPVFSNPSGQLPQHMAAQIGDSHPGKNQPSSVVDHPRQILLTAPAVPPDPLIARLDRFGGSSHQGTAQQSRLTEDEVAQKASHRLAVAKIMIAIDVFIPQTASISDFDHFKPNRTHLGQLPDPRRSGVGSLGRHGSTSLISAPARHPPLPRQSQQAFVLQLLQDIQARRYFVRPRGRHPAPVLANRPCQLLAAQPRTQPHRLPGRLQLLER